MQTKKKRIVIDTNLWISFLITKDFEKLDIIILEKKATLVFSQELLDEFLTVVKRPKFRRFFSSDDIENLLETIIEYAEFVKITSNTNVCRDSIDNFLLSLAIDGKADFLVTGDKDLLELLKFGKTNIISISDFLKSIL